MNNSGIYKITCNCTDDFYIGSTVNFRRRKASHWCEMRKGVKKGVWEDLLLTYGTESFSFEPIALAEESELIRVEDRLIRILKPTLNISLEASFRPYQWGSKNPNSKHSEEQIVQLFKTISERPWQSLAKIDRDLGFSRGTAWKVINAGRYKHVQKTHPELYDFVVSGRYQTLILESPEGVICDFMGTITEISRVLQMSDGHLFDLFYGHIPHAKGWKLV